MINTQFSNYIANYPAHFQEVSPKAKTETAVSQFLKKLFESVFLLNYLAVLKKFA